MSYIIVRDLGYVDYVHLVTHVILFTTDNRFDRDVVMPPPVCFRVPEGWTSNHFNKPRPIP